MRHEAIFNCIKIWNSKYGGNLYFDFEKKYGVLLKVHLRHTLCHFNNLGSQESNTSNGVQIKAKMNKL